jgi:hypothetical protein
MGANGCACMALGGRPGSDRVAEQTVAGNNTRALDLQGLCVASAATPFLIVTEGNGGPYDFLLD